MGLDNPIHIAFLVILLLLVFRSQAASRDGKVARAGHARLQGRDQRR